MKLNCKYCGEELNHGVKNCKVCNRHQNTVVDALRYIGLFNIVAVVAILLAFLQYKDAKEERKQAEEAAKIASEAKIQVDSLYADFLRRDSIMKNALLLNFQNRKIGLSYSLGVGLFPEDFYIKNDSLLIELLLPDKDERKNFSLKLDSLYFHK